MAENQTTTDTADVRPGEAQPFYLDPERDDWCEHDEIESQCKLPHAEKKADLDLMLKTELRTPEDLRPLHQQLMEWAETGGATSVFADHLTAADTLHWLWNSWRVRMHADAGEC